MKQLHLKDIIWCPGSSRAWTRHIPPCLFNYENQYILIWFKLIWVGYLSLETENVPTNTTTYAEISGHINKKWRNTPTPPNMNPAENAPFVVITFNSNFYKMCVWRRLISLSLLASHLQDYFKHKEGPTLPTGEGWGSLSGGNDGYTDLERQREKNE